MRLHLLDIVLAGRVKSGYVNLIKYPFPKERTVNQSTSHGVIHLRRQDVGFCLNVGIDLYYMAAEP